MRELTSFSSNHAIKLRTKLLSSFQSHTCGLEVVKDQQEMFYRACKQHTSKRKKVFFWSDHVIHSFLRSDDVTFFCVDSWKVPSPLYGELFAHLAGFDKRCVRVAYQGIISVLDPKYSSRALGEKFPSAGWLFFYFCFEIFVFFLGNPQHRIDMRKEMVATWCTFRVVPAPKVVEKLRWESSDDESVKADDVIETEEKSDTDEDDVIQIEDEDDVIDKEKTGKEDKEEKSDKLDDDVIDKEKTGNEEQDEKSDDDVEKEKLDDDVEKVAVDKTEESTGFGRVFRDVPSRVYENDGHVTQNRVLLDVGVDLKCVFFAVLFVFLGMFFFLWDQTKLLSIGLWSMI